MTVCFQSVCFMIEIFNFEKELTFAVCQRVSALVLEDNNTTVIWMHLAFALLEEKKKAFSPCRSYP